VSSSTIVVGDWVVAGTSAEDRDCGRIVALEGDMATIAWESGSTTSCDVSARDVEVYERRGAAMQRRLDLDSE
jgi:hypothetical protein